ncbi:MAG: FprA family A-type flavoprotein [Elusimicrobiota bacterium]|jgi:flavorubredoxin|nr:FprA family A-type flavoprotein [Elusimicrobiota bacterium]
MMHAIKITDKIYWVGALDWNLRDFHGYSTNHGTTYNAYLILDKKTVLIDTVKAPFYEEMLARIKSIIDPKKIDIIISNHAEMDHSGSLPRAIKDFEPEKVYASTLGVQNLKAQLGQDLPVEAVANGSTLEIGEDSLTFLESRMLHWPDSMVCLLNKANVLFSNDIFGMHYCSTARFEKDANREDWIYEFHKYYANIVMPYSKVVSAFLKTVAQKGIAPKTICPDHGLIWQESIKDIVEMYHDFALPKNKKKVVLVYDTMWGSTQKMAAAVVDGLVQAGVEVEQFSLHSEHRSDVVAEVLNSAGVIFGTPVMNLEIFPSLADTMTYLKGLKKEGLVGAAFGSYGWAPSAIDNLEKMMKDMKIEIVAPNVKCQFVPTEQKLKECFELGLAVGKKVLEITK